MSRVGITITKLVVGTTSKISAVHIVLELVKGLPLVRPKVQGRVTVVKDRSLFAPKDPHGIRTKCPTS